MFATGGKLPFADYCLQMAHWTNGYSQTELDEAQAKFGLEFPPDLVALLRDRRPIKGYDWRAEEDAIVNALRWPLEGILFDVEENAFWMPSWGERPSSPAERAEVVSAEVARAPKLIPIMGHRYIPEEPKERGNPVLSVWTDVIYYGSDLRDYFRREFGYAFKPYRARPLKLKRRIRFWSDLIEFGDA